MTGSENRTTIWHQPDLSVFDQSHDLQNKFDGPPILLLRQIPDRETTPWTYTRNKPTRELSQI